MRHAELRGKSLRVSVCGRLHGADAEVVEAALPLLTPEAQIRRIPQEYETWPTHAAASDLCIVVLSWPDEVPAETANAVVAACNASRLICCEGAWCASAGRTRDIWPRGVCVPVESLAARLRFELAVLNGEQAPLPATAALDEIYSAIYGRADQECRFIDQAGDDHRVQQ